MVITVGKVSKADLPLGRRLFIDYFIDLYKGLSLSAIGISCPLDVYLNAIFDKTEIAFNTGDLHASFAYINDNVAGFTAFELLEDTHTILIRTLPINLIYKNKEIAIRSAFIEYACNRFPNIQKTVILVRKANKSHINLCLQMGFMPCDKIFETSSYVKKTYNIEYYNSYVLYNHLK